MIFSNRLEFIDQCIASDKTQFEKIVSKEAFNTVDRGYDLYRDYIKQKSSVVEFSCEVYPDEVVFHIRSKKGIDELVSENMPKKGISTVGTDVGVDLNIKLIDVVSI